MSIRLNGASRLYPIIGDPIAQVKSPAGVTEMLQAQGLNALIVPMHVSSAAFADCLRSLQLTSNVDGTIITVPHKFAAAKVCATLSPRAQFLDAVNTIRRNENGSWHGDMFDGLGYVAAMLKNGCNPLAKRVLLVGAGGAGSAIAHALLEAGASALAVHDTDAQRRDTLVYRLSSLDLGQVTAGTSNPQDYDIVLNATPIGMAEGDPYPLQVSHLANSMFVGDVITAPLLTPLLKAAQSRGCATQTGADMFAAVRDLMVAFLLHKEH